jgi:excisionase family DNA binding protein
MPIGEYDTTKEAAELLWLTHGSVRDAVYRGALRAEQIARRSLIPVAEIDRYCKEVQGMQGWEKCQEPGDTPNEKQRAYQQAYNQCRKAAHTRQPAKEPAEKDERRWHRAGAVLRSGCWTAAESDGT